MFVVRSPALGHSQCFQFNLSLAGQPSIHSSAVSLQLESLIEPAVINQRVFGLGVRCHDLWCLLL